MDVRRWAGEARFKRPLAEVEGVPGVLGGCLDRDRGRPADSLALAWPVNYRFHRRSCPVPVLLRHRLLPQPNGFEGLLLGSVLVILDDLAVTEPQSVDLALLELRAARL